MFFLQTGIALAAHAEAIRVCIAKDVSQVTISSAYAFKIVDARAQQVLDTKGHIDRSVILPVSSGLQIAGKQYPSMGCSIKWNIPT